MKLALDLEGVGQLFSEYMYIYKLRSVKKFQIASLSSLVGNGKKPQVGLQEASQPKLG